VAQRTEIVFTDDLNGGPAEGTVTFEFDGASYEIDLSKKNADKLAKALQPYITAGRRVTGGTRAHRRGATRPARQDQSAVREWARSHGLKVSDRGRIPADITARYQAAQ
jgi:hypothetical protein